MGCPVIPPTAAGFQVVAFGTGNVSTRGGVSSTGRVVHDSHAVVAARRSLMRSVATVTRLLPAWLQFLFFMEGEKPSGPSRVVSLCRQVPVPAPADVFQPNGGTQSQVDLPAERGQRPPRPEERRGLSPLHQPAAKGCCSDALEAVSVVKSSGIGCARQGKKKRRNLGNFHNKRPYFYILYGHTHRQERLLWATGREIKSIE